MEEYFAAVHGLAGQVTHAVATALELPEDYFDAWFTTPMVIMSPLHYPPQKTSRGQEIDESRIGAGAHSDYGCLALLAQDDKGGLQVRNTAGRWIDASPVPGTFVVNVGDMLARWTNGPFPRHSAPGDQHLGRRPILDPVLLRPERRRSGGGHPDLPGRAREAQVRANALVGREQLDPGWSSRSPPGRRPPRLPGWAGRPRAPCPRRCRRYRIRLARAAPGNRRYGRARRPGRRRLAPPSS